MKLTGNILLRYLRERGVVADFGGKADHQEQNKKRKPGLETDFREQFTETEPERTFTIQDRGDAQDFDWKLEHADRYRETGFESLSSCPELEGPLIWEGQKLRAGWVYAAEISKIAKVPREELQADFDKTVDVLLVLVGEDHFLSVEKMGCSDDPEYQEAKQACDLLTQLSRPGVKFHWIRLHDDVTLGEAVNLLSDAFAFYGNWQERMEEIQYRFGTVEEMLEASLPVFQNPLMVLDTELSVVSWVSAIAGSVVDDINSPRADQTKVDAADMADTEQTGKDAANITSADQIRKRDSYAFFGKGRERMEVINAILQDPDYMRGRTRTDSYWGPEYHLGFRSGCWNVIRGDEPQYCLCVVEDGRTLEEADLDLLALLGRHVKFGLYHQERRGAGRFEDLGKLLRRILTDRTLDYLEASRLLADMGWGRNDSYLCLVYQLTYLDRNVLPTVSICRYMEEQYACCSFLHEDHIVTFFDLTRCHLPADEIQKQLKPFIRDSYLKAGFSRSVAGHMHLRHQYVQASLALDVGSRRYPYQWIHYFDQIAFIYIQEQVTRRLPGELLVHEGLLRLREKDREQGTEYRKTLRVYLDNHLNAVHSARDLYIHRSTFLYRLEKIREIMESDLTDPEEILYLGLSLRLMELGE